MPRARVSSFPAGRLGLRRSGTIPIVPERQHGYIIGLFCALHMLLQGSLHAPDDFLRPVLRGKPVLSLLDAGLCKEGLCLIYGLRHPVRIEKEGISRRQIHFILPVRHLHQSQHAVLLHGQEIILSSP